MGFDGTVVFVGETEAFAGDATFEGAAGLDGVNEGFDGTVFLVGVTAALDGTT